MLRIALFLLLVQFSTCLSQVPELNVFLVQNKLNVIDIKYNGTSHMDDLVNVYFKSMSYIPKLEMKAIIYDTSKIAHKKLLANLKFKIRDTVLIYDWDTQGGVYPFNVTACKFTYSKGDSTLTLYNVQDITRNGNAKPSPIKRNFKVLKVEKDKFTLLDKDNRDVRRNYVFKKALAK